MATLGELEGTSIYRVPLQAPITIAQDIKYNVLALEPLLTDVTLQHSLSIPGFPRFVQQSSLLRRNKNLKTDQQCKLMQTASLKV
ncbi:hypothetical protein AZE42_10286 [Rhizopogon vesiculosus]|uniref:Uncharacterized protein n=1 Tax=Rhizopogon vesiculosus TaxID=180088 RepID=A0A1J8QIJ7_9AGAM|nr:hypothetical protein AZE42_10286 [Rhizopogon vesiculosus]